MKTPAQSLIDILDLPRKGERLLAKGQSLFCAGDLVHNLYCVKSGEIQMVRNLGDGTTVLLYVGTAGQTFAEASLFSETYHCDAVTNAETLIYLYDKAHVLDILRNNEKKAFDFMAHMARQVMELRGHVELINVRAAHERVLAYIQSQMPAGSLHTTIAQPWNCIAAHIGLSPEAVYRALAKLQHDGKLKREGKRIFLSRVP
ncbi:MAG: Crp/Fnr family transcriptional regulator [Magnetovibrio sp.]|nr:Crp/Fnr family transcriptional regulator [Magnetovibrio sp.]